MPIIIAILTIVGGAIWFWARNNPRDALDLAQDAVTTARNAPRKLAFRQQTKAHPVEGIDDPRIAVCAIGQSFLELDALPTQDQRDRMHVSLRSILRCTEEEAEEMQVLGRWLMGQCQSPAQAITRLGRRLYKIDGNKSWDDLTALLHELVEAELSPAQVDAIADLKRTLRV